MLNSMDLTALRLKIFALGSYFLLNSFAIKSDITRTVIGVKSVLYQSTKHGAKLSRHLPN